MCIVTTTINGQMAQQRTESRSLREIAGEIAGYIPLWGDDFISAPEDGYFWWTSPLGNKYEIEVTE